MQQAVAASGAEMVPLAPQQQGDCHLVNIQSADHQIDQKPVDNPVRVLLIAGSDSAGAAGIQADMATCYGLQAHPLSAITAVTAQHSKAVTGVNPVPEEVLAEQIKAVWQDGQPDAIKIGLVANRKQADILVSLLSRLSGRRGSVPVVWDPVMTSSSGTGLIDDKAWMPSLFARVDVITPNVDEAERITGLSIQSPEDMLKAAATLQNLGCTGVWLKGGHRHFTGYPQQHIDLLCWQGRHYWFVQSHLSVEHSRGTGCTLATALAVFQALLRSERSKQPCSFDEQPCSSDEQPCSSGEWMLDAAVLASAYVHQGLRQGYRLAGKPGPIAHKGWPERFTDFPAVADRLDQLGQLRAAPGEAEFPNCGEEPLGLYPVVESLEWVEKLLTQGVRTMQLRIKEMAADELEMIISAAIQRCQKSGCRLFINDYWQLAIKLGAYGVHLGQQDIEQADIDQLRKAGIRLGISTHSEFEWVRAASLRPSYLAIGAIYPTQTKAVVVVGNDNLKRWVSILKPHFPLTAIGGIDKQNIGSVLASGIESAAVVSAIVNAEDYAQATRHLMTAFPACSVKA